MMERLLAADPNETPVSFEIGDIIDNSNINMEELDSVDIPDSVLSAIILETNTDFEQNIEQVASKNIEDKKAIEKVYVKRRSKPRVHKLLNSNDVDEIAGKSCKKKTHRQTTWGVNVFRGNKLHSINY